MMNRGSRADRARLVFRSGRRHRGATLVEAALAAGAALLLGTALLPGLGMARYRGQEATCTTNLSGFGQALQSYVNDNQEYIPGVNTSGVAVRAKALLWGSNPSVLHQSDLPVQSWDWMTPLAVYGFGLPANRAARWHELWTEYRCPAQRPNAEVYNPGATPDAADFMGYTWPGCSYLMSCHFSYWGTTHSGEVLSAMEGFPQVLVRARTVPSGWEVTYADYASRLTQVGPPDRKAFVVDGTRYLGASGVLDFDISPDPLLMGAFTDSGGWWPGAVAYGVKVATPNWDGAAVHAGSPSGGRNLLLSYRHWPPAGRPAAAPAPGGSAQTNAGAINVAYFDGHVAPLTDRQSREVSLWYPTGAVVQDSVGMTSEPVGYVIP